jgi:hypothetical protein
MKRFLASAVLSIVLLAAGHLAAAVRSGDTAPAFRLQDLQGATRTLAEFRGKVVVLEWINVDCPFVKKHYGSGNMQALQRAYKARGVIWLTIAGSAPGKQGHYPAAAWPALLAERKAAPSALLLDPAGIAGRAYGAKTTPHLFVIDRAGKLVYTGAIDDKPSTNPADIKGAVKYLAAALDAHLAGKPVAVADTKPYGCSVKY